MSQNVIKPTRTVPAPLTAKVTLSDTGRVKCPKTSNVHILSGEMVVATAILGGNYNQQQALAEFRRNQKRFTLKDGYAVVSAFRLV